LKFSISSNGNAWRSANHSISGAEPARDGFDQRREGFAMRLALDISRQPVCIIGDAFGALKARASGRNKPS